MNRPPSPWGVDARAARFGQGLTGLLAGVALTLSSNALLAGLALVLAAGALLGPRWNLWGQLFTRIVRPALGLPVAGKRKAPAPVRFANLVGAVFLAGAFTLNLLGLTAVAAALVVAVAALALLAAATDYCVGCELYNLAVRVFGRAPART